MKRSVRHIRTEAGSKHRREQAEENRTAGAEPKRLFLEGGKKLARSNYQFKKRQKELARKKKKEEKRQRKLEKNTVESEENPDQSQNETADL